ncbi:MAG: PAS domain-containing protein [Planctomycetes bacterium]|nr:PAS domain-containing protein [Planctomycetota bacterium]
MAVGLLIGVIAGWLASSFRAMQGLASIAPIFYIISALGVSWLGWRWVRLIGAISSVTEFLKQNKSSHIKSSDDVVINELVEAINGRFGGNTSYISELEEQLKDSQLKVQLLRRQKMNADAIIYSIRDAVIVTDELDRLLMANEAAGQLFGFDFKNSQHKGIGELINTDGKEFTNFLRQNRQNKARATRREIELGDARTFDCIASCVYGEEEQVCGVVAVLHDITREKEISQMKNDFVDHVSHELKTPLSSIAAYTEMLLDGEAKDEKTKEEFYSVIQGQTDRLGRLIEDILNVSRIESGLIKVDKKPVSLAVLIEEQLKMIKGYADEKKIRLEDVGKNVVVFGQVYADKDMISQVIVNLLSNAIKYTPSGGSVRVETEVDEIAQVMRVNVTDTGVGIPKDEVEHVFDKFYRVDANKSQAKGTGLGLNLVKQIVEKIHDGRIYVSSEVGVGSTFGFELPLATAKMAGVTSHRESSKSLSEEK